MKKLTDGNIYKNFLYFGIPIALSGLLSQCYGIINSAIAGRFLGAEGLAATGATSSLISFLSSIFWGYGTGFSIYAARLFGAGKNKDVKNVVYSNLRIIFLVSLAIAICVIIFCNHILDWLNVDPEIKADSAAYLCIYMCGFCIITVNTSSVFVMQALGASSFPFWMSLISGILTVSGNVVSVVVLELGVKGIAMSTVLAVLIVRICYIFKMKKCFRQLGVADSKVEFGFGLFKNSFSYGGASMLQQMIMYAASVMVSPTINALGAAATAGYSVANQINTTNAQLYQSASKCVSNYIAQAIGVGKGENIKKGVKVGFIQGIMFLTPLLLICVFFARGVNGIFFSESGDKEAFDIAMIFSKVYLPFLYINVINNLFHALFRGIGASALLGLSTAIGAVSRVLLSIILPCKMGMHGIYLAWVLSWVIEAVFSTYIYFSGKWKKAL